LAALLRGLVFMIILAINCGSSTVKFLLADFQDKEKIPIKGKKIVSGIIDKVGGQGTIQFFGLTRKQQIETVMIHDHGEAMQFVLERLESLNIINPSEIRAVGHRVVHGGEQFIEPTRISDQVINKIESLNDFAPLHNPPSIKAIRAVRAILGESVPQVVIFDTAFHHFLPEWASKYAIPIEISEKYHIRRYGFHGIAHRYMAERFSSLISTPLNQTRVITLQLGNGCSVAAIKNGISVDTSMGFTPLEGLIMGTRAGDMDPSLVGFLMRREGIGIDEVENLLNKRSGLLGISGRSRDMRELLKAENQGDKRSALAVDMFCYRVRKYIGAYLAVLGGAQAVIFGGGIGENAPGIRSRICEGLDWCGLMLDSKLNAGTIGVEGRISKDESKIPTYVIPVDETIIIARETVRYLHCKCKQG
jgi:acetate kinase